MNTEYVPAKIVIGAYEFLSEEYNIDSISITTGSYDGNVVGIGSAYSPSCRVTMDNVDAIDVGVVFSVYFKKNGAWENYGKFVITEEPDVYNREKMSFVGEGYIYSIMSKQYKGVPGIGYNIELGTEIQYDLFIKKFQSEFGFELIFSDSIKNELCTRHPINILLPQEKTDTTLYAWEFIKISWREWLQGIAILFGANVIEKNGKIYITELENSFSETETIQISSSDCAELKLSRKDYTINGIKIKYQKTNDLDKPWDAEETYNWDINGPNVGISGTGEASIKYNLTFVENAIAYQYEIFCSWLRGTILYFNAKRIIEQDIYDEGSELNPQYIAYFPEEAYLPNELIKANNVVYRPGVIEYSGIVDGIEAGKVILIKNEDETSYKFYVGEMTLEWDGGFKTILSCNSPANNSSSSASSSISGGINVQTPASSSYASLIQGLLGHVSLNFADITFSNIKDSTISGSKFIDGSIEGSKISDSTLTGSKFKDGTIEGSKINFSTFEDGVISGTAIDTSTFKDGSISGSSFVDGTIENSKIKDSTLTGAKIADATIGFEKVDTSFIKKLTADKAYIDSLSANVASISTLKATDAIIKNIFSQEIVSDKAILDVLQANIINAEYIKSAVADVGYITADEADISYADITLGNIDTANVDKANIGLLFNEVGLIDRATIVDGHITGFLDAVEINADKITAGTLIADRILLKGSESGLLYALNNLGELTSTEVDTLDGTILTQRTVTADKLVANSITANELDVTNIFGNSAVLTTLTSQQAFINAISTNSVVVGVDNKAQGIIDNIYTQNTTTIDGGKITTGSIKASSINVDDLFAQDITATGTITGATLKGAKIYSEIGEIAGFILKDKSFVSDFTQTEATTGVVYDFKNEINSQANSEKWLIETTRTGHKTGIVGNKACFGIDGVELRSLNHADDYYDKFMWLSTRSLTFGVNSGTPYNGSNIAFDIDSGYSAITSSGEFTIEPSCTINVPTTVNNNLTITDTLNTYKAEVTGSLSIGDKLIGGKWCYNDTTSYGLYWSSASVLRPISSSYKVSLGSSSYPMSSIYATYLYDDGVRVVGRTYSTRGNFRCYKHRDGRLVIEYLKKLTSAVSLGNSDGNAYYATIISSTTTFPVQFTDVPMVISDIGRADLTAPFCSLSVEGVTETGFSRILAWAPSNISTTKLPVGSTVNTLFIGRWK